ncbi:ParB/RepB/Spo0J family partition protein [Xenorhabdus bovienii]|uniref:ParB/RepB/Spo0J family partition protein n=1 Tax=Xenorhabdus bovienii TaxID=40576 RepID=UPI003DA2F90D
MTKKPFTLNIPALESISRSASANQKNIAGQVFYVDPDECYVVVNPRTKYNEALIESYVQDFLDERQGQREPCTVYPKDDKGYRIHHGATRTLAGKKAKEIKSDWKLKIIIDPSLQTRSDFENYWEQGTNNVARDNMNLLDVANWIIKSKTLAKAEGKTLTQESIAKSIGQTGAWVSKVQALAELPDYLIEVYQNGETVDPWTLNSLLKIHKANESLCRDFIESGEVGRSSAQKVLKAMSLDVLKTPTDSSKDAEQQPVTSQNSTNDITSKESVMTRNQDDEVIFDFMHAQKIEVMGGATGEAFIYVQPVDNLWISTTETTFRHEFNATPSVSSNLKFASKEAAEFAALVSLKSVAENILTQRRSLLEEESMDAEMLLSSIDIKLNSNGTENNELTDSSKDKKNKAAKKIELQVAGRWNGIDCVIMMKKTEQPNHVVIKLLSDSSIKEIAAEEFTLTGYFECGH